MCDTAVGNVTKHNSIVLIMDTVQEYDTDGKDDFIKELLSFMTPEQVNRVHVCLNYNTPLGGDHK